MSDTRQSPPPDDERWLWDRSGPEDPHVARLEKALAPLAHRAPLAPPSNGTARSAPAAKRTRRGRAVAVAVAALAVAAAASWVALQPFGEGAVTPSTLVASRRAPRNALSPNACSLQTPGSYAFRSEGGPLRCGKGEAATGWMAIDEVLETHNAKATLEVATLGSVALEPNTRLRVLAAENGVETLDLLRGTVRARINAAPRRFVVRTPAAHAVDLGCEYTLSVEDDGRGRLSVSYGAVSLERPDRAPTLVTQGASCPIGPTGPGTPLVDGTSDALRRAGAELDAGDGSAFDRVVASSSARDTLTLWHVMRRISPEERGRAYDRLATFVPAPKSAAREAVVRGDHAAIAAYKEALMPLWFAGGSPKK